MMKRSPAKGSTQLATRAPGPRKPIEPPIQLSELPFRIFVLALLPTILMFAIFAYGALRGNTSVIDGIMRNLPFAFAVPVSLAGGIAAFIEFFRRR
jgi:hypothetical protein